ncbi:MAG: hypothetical protein H6Q67_1859 [Firmicutes bacterium]|nr:hypothetical protein [Bacillota bacterium]
MHNVEYNSINDILYIRFDNVKDTYEKEVKEGIVLKFDSHSNALVELSILCFRQRVTTKSISLPIPIDLQRHMC